MGAVNPPLGMTSPLGIGAGAPVGGTGLPLGATELATPGVSPMTSGSPPQRDDNDDASACSAPWGRCRQQPPAWEIRQAEPPRSGRIFGDGGYIRNLGATRCSTALGSPEPRRVRARPPRPHRPVQPHRLRLQPSLAYHVGRVGIPVGSTELGTGGLSPLRYYAAEQSTVVPTGRTPCHVRRRERRRWQDHRCSPAAADTTFIGATSMRLRTAVVASLSS